MPDSEVAVEGFDVVLAFIEAVSVEDFGDVVGDDGAGFVDVEVDLE